MTADEPKDVRLLKPAQDVWQAAQDVLRKTLSEPSFRVWIKPLRIVSLEAGVAVFAVHNDFMRGMIANKFKDPILTALSEVLREPVSIKLVIDPSIAVDEYVPTIASISIIPAEQKPEPTAGPTSGGTNSAPSGHTGSATASTKANLNSKYTFSTFVVGSHNRFCHSAASAVAERPAQAYNPLFLYGGVGLGKTHIMQAIGHEILRSSPHLSVRYITCERFTNELINSIRDDRMVEFRRRYRQVDVLLMDDIQFIQGKESTQEEFFHTFNALRDSSRQIVLSSDRPPKDISLLEERLRSRFEWGLIADIQIPDLETRVAILRKKCELDHIMVPDDLLEHIASLFTTNIRELEGALIRANAYANLTGAELSVESLSAILQPVGPARPRANLTLDLIIQTVAEHFQIEPSEMRSVKRSHDLSLPRHVAMYLAHELIQMSFPRIGQAFANRKHTSALYAHKRIKELLMTDAALAQQVTAISRKVTS
jgi:chromosomal replication initiator protein